MTDDLLEEERVALGSLEDARVHGPGQVVDREEQADELARLFVRERIEGQR